MRKRALGFFGARNPSRAPTTKDFAEEGWPVEIGQSSRLSAPDRPEQGGDKIDVLPLYKSNQISDDGARLSRVVRSVGDDRGATRARQLECISQMFGFEGIERLARNIAVSFNHASGGDLRHKEPHKWPRTAVSLFGPTISGQRHKGRPGPRLQPSKAMLSGEGQQGRRRGRPQKAFGSYLDPPFLAGSARARYFRRCKVFKSLVKLPTNVAANEVAQDSFHRSACGALWRVGENDLAMGEARCRGAREVQTVRSGAFGSRIRPPSSRGRQGCAGERA